MSELVDARGRKYLTKPERERFLAAALSNPKPAVQTLVRTLAMTGCHVCEALGLRACDIDLKASEVRVATLKRRKTHRRAVPVPEDLGAGPGARAPRAARARERAGRESAPLAHHPANREPPRGRARPAARPRTASAAAPFRNLRLDGSTARTSVEAALCTSRRRLCPATLGELPVQRLGARSDLARNRSPGAPWRKLIPVPRNPSVEPFANGPKREDLRAKACRLKLVRKVEREGLGEPGICG